MSSEYDRHFGEFRFGLRNVEWNLAPSGLYAIRWDNYMLVMRRGSKPTPEDICPVIEAFEQGMQEGKTWGRADLARDIKRLLGI